jgi:hypothetical protein
MYEHSAGASHSGKSATESVLKTAAPTPIG